MHVVRTDTRPARLALCLSLNASPRVLRRAFRLVGGRWGGCFDVLVSVAPDGSIRPFHRAVLQAADPDFMLAIDPQLEAVDLWALAANLRLQPFDVMRFREGAEHRSPLQSLFRERPTAGGGRSPQDLGEILDCDRPGLTWRLAAEHGLPSTRTRRIRVASPSHTPTPAELSRRELRFRVGGQRWLLFGGDQDVDLALRFWSLRALGCRPIWTPVAALDGAESPVGLSGWTTMLCGPDIDASRLERAAAAWRTRRYRVLAADERSQIPQLPRGGAYFATQTQPAIEYRRLLRFSLPPPPITDEPLSRGLDGVADHRLLSPDPAAPDGLILAPCEQSRDLVQVSDEDEMRITRYGVAERRDIARPALVTLPRVTYRDAVAAPFEELGYEVTNSDKGRYQQRSLELGRGLRFLAWCLRQRDSARLLDLFFENHLGGRSRADYRRAVTLDDLQTRLLDGLRVDRRRLRGPLLVAARRWLDGWSNALIERGLLIGGYVLLCRHCAHRAWYRIDDIGQEFVCDRCAARSHLPVDAALSFRLNEAFWQLRHHNGEVVTLLLAVLREQARASLLYLPEVMIDGDGLRQGEADVAALVDGALVLAEAKSNSALSNAEIGWYRTIAARARARRLIFATTARSQPWCATLSCDVCEQQGKHHRDHAWDDGSRRRIEETRLRLRDAGVEVSTYCYETLVTAHPDAKRELMSFVSLPDD